MQGVGTVDQLKASWVRSILEAAFIRRDAQRILA
jgi:hypothetical protein